MHIVASNTNIILLQKVLVHLKVMMAGEFLFKYYYNITTYQVRWILIKWHWWSNVVIYLHQTPAQTIPCIIDVNEKSIFNTDYIACRSVGWHIVVNLIVYCASGKLIVEQVPLNMSGDKVVWLWSSPAWLYPCTMYCQGTCPTPSGTSWITISILGNVRSLLHLTREMWSRLKCQSESSLRWGTGLVQNTTLATCSIKFIIKTSKKESTWFSIHLGPWMS